VRVTGLGVQTAALLHGPVEKDMVSYLKSRGLVVWGYISSCVEMNEYF
jgi:hypothetical protein